MTEPNELQSPENAPDAPVDDAEPRLDAAIDDAQGDVGEVEMLRQQNHDLFERLARVNADFANARRRLEQDLQQRAQYANSELIRQLLPVIDNFERALQVDPDSTDAASLLKGMQIVHDDWMAVLRKHQCEQIAPEAGTPFDPNLHSAMMQQEDDRYEHQVVLSVLQKGYALHGRTLRPAAVCVSKPR